MPAPVTIDLLTAELRRLEARMDGLQLVMQQRWIADERASDMALKTLTDRLEGMNQFRSQILDERALYVRAEQFRDHLAWSERTEMGMSARLERLEAGQSNTAGRFWAISTLVTLVSVASALFSLFGGRPHP